MSDDWSLKGKERMISDDVGNPNFDFESGATLDEWFETRAYKKDDIDILRKKLIEDLINYEGFLSQKGDGDSTLECPKSEIIDLINKRFGVVE